MILSSHACDFKGHLSQLSSRKTSLIICSDTVVSPKFRAPVHFFLCTTSVSYFIFLLNSMANFMYRWDLSLPFPILTSPPLPPHTLVRGHSIRLAEWVELALSSSFLVHCSCFPFTIHKLYKYITVIYWIINIYILNKVRPAFYRCIPNTHSTYKWVVL